MHARTPQFALEIVRLTKRIPCNATSGPLINQLVKSGTSIGANYCEADNAFSKREFIHRIGICRKEAKETEYWLPLVAEVAVELEEWICQLRQEAHELNLIFSAIVNRARSKNKEVHSG